MIRNLFVAAVLSAAAFASSTCAWAGQAPAAASAPDIPVSHHDRFYTSDQFSNTVSVIDPADNKLLGVIRLGEPVPANLSPLYKGQLLVHGGINASLADNGCVYPTDVATLFNQFNAAGVSWKAYAQDLGGAQPVGSTSYVTGTTPGVTDTQLAAIG